MRIILMAVSVFCALGRSGRGGAWPSVQIPHEKSCFDPDFDWKVRFFFNLDRNKTY